MSASIPPDLVDEVNKRSREKLIDLLHEVIERQKRADGSTYGDQALTPEQRIARFYDYAQKGVFDTQIMRTERPDLMKRLLKQFHEDITLVNAKVAKQASAALDTPPLPGVPPLPQAPPVPPLTPVPAVPGMPGQIAA